MVVALRSSARSVIRIRHFDFYSLDLCFDREILDILEFCVKVRQKSVRPLVPPSVHARACRPGSLDQSEIVRTSTAICFATVFPGRAWQREADPPADDITD
jgi:hypothetical protein